MRCFFGLATIVLMTVSISMYLIAQRLFPAPKTAAASAPAQPPVSQPA